MDHLLINIKIAWHPFLIEISYFLHIHMINKNFKSHNEIIFSNYFHRDAQYLPNRILYLSKPYIKYDVLWFWPSLHDVCHNSLYLSTTKSGSLAGIIWTWWSLDECHASISIRIRIQLYWKLVPLCCASWQFNMNWFNKNGSQLIWTLATHISSTFSVVVEHWSFWHFLNNLQAISCVVNLTILSFI